MKRILTELGPELLMAQLAGHDQRPVGPEEGVPVPGLGRPHRLPQLVQVKGAQLLELVAIAAEAPVVDVGGEGRIVAQALAFYPAMMFSRSPSRLRSRSSSPIAWGSPFALLSLALSNMVRKEEGMVNDR